VAPFLRFEADALMAYFHRNSSVSRRRRIVRAAEERALEVVVDRLYDGSLGGFIDYKWGSANARGRNEIPSWVPTVAAECEGRPCIAEYPEIPYWQHVNGFVLSDQQVTELVPKRPPTTYSSEFIYDAEQSRRFVATGEGVKAEAAHFWQQVRESPYGLSGAWVRATLEVLNERRFLSDLKTSAQIMRVLSTAIADAGVVAWRAKFEYNTARPLTVHSVVGCGEGGCPAPAAGHRRHRASREREAVSVACTVERLFGSVCEAMLARLQERLTIGLPLVKVPMDPTTVCYEK